MRRVLAGIVPLIASAALLSAVAALPVKADPAWHQQGDEYVPVEVTQYVPCINEGAGEDVYISGGFHFIWSMTGSANHFESHNTFVPQDMFAVGQVTGNQYKVVGSAQFLLNYEASGGGTNEDTMLQRLRFVGYVPGDNFHLNVVWTVRWNANHVPVVVRGSEEIVCR
jgi:hypothetical protein